MATVVKTKWKDEHDLHATWPCQTLSSSVTELCEGSMENAILSPEWSVAFLMTDMCHFSLLCHIRIYCRHVRSLSETCAPWKIRTGNFRNYRKVEHNRERENEDRYGEVNPLNVLESSNVISGFLEKHIGAQDWSDDCSNCLHGLCQIDSQFGIARRTSHWETLRDDALEQKQGLDTHQPYKGLQQFREFPNHYQWWTWLHKILQNSVLGQLATSAGLQCHTMWVPEWKSRDIRNSAKPN